MMGTEVVSLCLLSWLQGFLKSLCSHVYQQEKGDVQQSRETSPLIWPCRTSGAAGDSGLASELLLLLRGDGLEGKLVFLQFFSLTFLVLQVCALFHHPLLFSLTCLPMFVE